VSSHILGWFDMKVNVTSMFARASPILVSGLNQSTVPELFNDVWTGVRIFAKMTSVVFIVSRNEKEPDAHGCSISP
jgi:hypothetical protein